MLKQFILIILLILSLSADPGLGITTKHDLSAYNPDQFLIEVFPTAPYHVGDVLSVRLTYFGDQNLNGKDLVLSVDWQSGRIEETQAFSSHSNQAVFYWFLDTTGGQPEFLRLNFSIPEEDLSWVTGIQLLPEPPERDHEWRNARTACCNIHYLSGSDAETDLVTIQQTLDERTQIAMEQFSPMIQPGDTVLEDPLKIVLIPIVIGHGGFATDRAVLTYSHDNWAGIQFENLSHHEIVHVIDRQLNKGPRPSLISEGIAVYLSGGHYRQGDALQHAAALLELGLLFPLEDLANAFYQAQHEIGYMQAAGLVAYLSEIWGWETFLAFYFNLPEGETPSELISSALEVQFGFTLADLEMAFIEYLSQIEPDEAVIKDVQLTIEVYDTLRRYQTLLIPSAHFQSAWWPPVEIVIKEGITGDYGEREKSPMNVILESLFIRAHQGLDTKDYPAVETNLEKLNALLDTIETDTLPIYQDALGWALPFSHHLFTRPMTAPGFGW